MTILTKKSNKYEQCRVAFREHFNNGLKPSDGSQPMSDDQAKEIVQRLINAKVPKDGLIGVLDAFLILCTHLKEAGYNNIVLLEQEHQKLTKKQKEYYNKIKILCEKSNIQYYIPPNNNYENCKMNFSAALGNPAYKDQIHLKMLLILLERSDTVVLTHPSGWLTRFTAPKEKEVKAALKGRSQSIAVNPVHCVNGNPTIPPWDEWVKSTSKISQCPVIEVDCHCVIPMPLYGKSVDRPFKFRSATKKRSRSYCCITGGRKSV